MADNSYPSRSVIKPFLAIEKEGRKKTAGLNLKQPQYSNKQEGLGLALLNDTTSSPKPAAVGTQCFNGGLKSSAVHLPITF